MQASVSNIRPIICPSEVLVFIALILVLWIELIFKGILITVIFGPACNFNQRDFNFRVQGDFTYSYRVQTKFHGMISMKINRVCNVNERAMYKQEEGKKSNHCCCRFAYLIKFFMLSIFFCTANLQILSTYRLSAFLYQSWRLLLYRSIDGTQYVSRCVISHNLEEPSYGLQLYGLSRCCSIYPNF